MCGLWHGTCGSASYPLVPGLGVLAGPVTASVPVWDSPVRPPPKQDYPQKITNMGMKGSKASNASEEYKGRTTG